MAEGQVDAPRIGWIESNQNVALVIAYLVLALYVAPVFLAAFSWWNTGGFQEESFYFGWFVAFIGSADSTLNHFHKILLPILTTLSVVAFAGPPSRGILGLGAFLLMSFCVTVVVAVIFDMQVTLDAVGGLRTQVKQEVAKAFFVRVQESLMSYIMLLFGLGIANKVGK